MVPRSSCAVNGAIDVPEKQENARLLMRRVAELNCNEEPFSPLSIGMYCAGCMLQVIPMLIVRSGLSP